jgi:hypothetical protein
LGSTGKSTPKPREAVLKNIADAAGRAFISRSFPVNFSKLILGLYGAAFVAVALWAVAFFVQMHRDFTALRALETHNQRRLAEAETTLAAQEKYLTQLRHDPALVERLIRQKLGYARGAEYVFRFDESGRN